MAMEMELLKMYFLLNMMISHCHVSLPCTSNIPHRFLEKTHCPPLRLLYVGEAQCCFRAHFFEYQEPGVIKWHPFEGFTFTLIVYTLEDEYGTWNLQPSPMKGKVNKIWTKPPWLWNPWFHFQGCIVWVGTIITTGNWDEMRWENDSVSVAWHQRCGCDEMQLFPYNKLILQFSSPSEKTLPRKHLVDPRPKKKWGCF